MKNLLYVIVLILVIVWLIGFLAYNVGPIIHILLVIAAIVFIVKIVQGKKIF
ncbi:MAG: lmo0937 family membrane protein [Salinivirgaceae bacterium]|jgi:hypothetical protein|nr:lmo0937 family membrane protein [Salinivirgaceae bacterium]